jgi:hypothetical protein
MIYLSVFLSFRSLGRAGQKAEFLKLNQIGCFRLNAIKKLSWFFGAFSIVFNWLLVYVLG